MLRTGTTEVSSGGGIARFIASAIDCAAVGCFLILISVILTGGWTGHVFQLEVSAHQPENPGFAMLALLLLRRLIDRRTPVHDIPLIRTIGRVFVFMSPRTERGARVVLCGMVTGYIVSMGAVVCMKHSAFRSHAFDLGIFSQVFWSAANGFGLHSSILNSHFLGEHFSPILYLLIPGYHLWPQPEYLLMVQTAALSLAAVPLYLIASSELKSRNWGLLFALLYLCYEPMRNVNMYDFHEIALATPLLMLAFLLLHKRRTVAFLLVLAAALACKEEIATIVFIFGVYLFLIQKRRVLGTALSFSGIAIFFTLILIVIPQFRNAPYGFVSRYGYLGQDIPAILTTLATRPLYVLSHLLTRDKMEYLWELFGPLGFLSLASPAHLLLAAPTLIQNLLSDCPPQYSTSFQYTSPLTPFIFISAVFGVRNIILRTRAAGVAKPAQPVSLSSLPIVLLLVALTFTGESPVWHLREYRPTRYSRYVRGKVLPAIPASASVSAQESFVPHLTRREKLYEFPVAGDAEYVLLDSRANRWPMDSIEYFGRVNALMMSTPHSVVLSNGSVLLLRRCAGTGTQSDPIPDAFLAQRVPEYDESAGK